LLLNPATLAALREFDEPGKSDFFNEIIEAYLSDTGERMLRLQAEHDAGDAENLAKTAHAIKGSSLNVGAEDFAALMHSLEKAGKSGSAGSPADLAEAHALYGKLRATLASLL
jgi:two-component system, sensor histidine kinase and response regulator